MIDAELRVATLDPSGAEQFIRDNAVSLVREMEAKIAKQREELTRLNKRNQAYKEQLIALRGRVACLEATAARLQRGEFTPEEFQALCHHRDERPGCTPENFNTGCGEYQARLFDAASCWRPPLTRERVAAAVGELYASGAVAVGKSAVTDRLCRLLGVE